MKKFFASILTLLIVVFTVAGCGGSSTSAPTYTAAKDGEWMEIQSITYSGASNGTLTSHYSYKLDEREQITKEEYANAPDEFKILNYASNSVDIDINRSDLINNKHIGKFFFIVDYYSETFYKATLDSYTVHYVKIRFMADGTLELNYYKNDNDDYTTTVRVKPTSYTVTYFNK